MTITRSASAASTPIAAPSSLRPLADARLERLGLAELAGVGAQRVDLAIDRRRDVDPGRRAAGPEQVQAADRAAPGRRARATGTPSRCGPPGRRRRRRRSPRPGGRCGSRRRRRRTASPGPRRAPRPAGTCGSRARAARAARGRWRARRRAGGGTRSRRSRRRRPRPAAPPRGGAASSSGSVRQSSAPASPLVQHTSQPAEPSSIQRAAVAAGPKSASSGWATITMNRAGRHAWAVAAGSPGQPSPSGSERLGTLARNDVALRDADCRIVVLDLRLRLRSSPPTGEASLCARDSVRDTLRPPARRVRPRGPPGPARRARRPSPSATPWRSGRRARRGSSSGRCPSTCAP